MTSDDLTIFWLHSENKTRKEDKEDKEDKKDERRGGGGGPTFDLLFLMIYDIKRSIDLR